MEVEEKNKTDLQQDQSDNLHDKKDNNVVIEKDKIEKEKLWHLVIKAFPQYKEYRNTTDREIPFFIAS